MTPRRCLFALPLALVSTIASAGQGEQRPHYVAMGSSYAAGAGIGPVVPETPRRCGRTVNNYAHLLAEHLGLSLTDVGCGGARTEHILSPWRELPAQIDAVTRDTRLVTVTIGGNDINYVGEFGGARCRKLKREQGDAADCAIRPSATEAQWASLRRNLTAIARAVRERAPESRLVFVTYLPIIPNQGACDALPIDPADAVRIRGVFDRLATVTREVADAEGATLLDSGRIGAGHDACSATPYAAGFPGGKVPWHPTAAGHQAIAAALAKTIVKPR